MICKNMKEANTYIATLSTVSQITPMLGGGYLVVGVAK